MSKSLFMGKVVRRDKDLLIELGKRLKTVRESKNITHEKIDQALKITIYKYEKAQLNISLSILAVICKYYKISLSDLLEGLNSSLPIDE